MSPRKTRRKGLSAETFVVVHGDPTFWRRMSRSPEELFLAGLCIVAALPTLLGGPRSGSLEAALPSWLVIAWAIELLLGGVLIAVGIFLRGHRVEMAGLMMGFTALAYSLLLFSFVGFAGVVSVAVTIAYGLACLARARHYRRYLAGSADAK